MQRMIIVTRDTTESLTLVVEGATQGECERAALKQAQNPDARWTIDDTYNISKDHYITLSEEM